MTTPPEIDSDLVAQLLRAAGRREEPPGDVYNQTLEIATVAWRRKVRGRMRQRRIGWSAAACVVAAVATALLIGKPWWTPAPQLVASVERVIGSVKMRRERHDHWVLLDATTRGFPAGAWLQTGDAGRVGVRLSGGASLRLGPATELVVEAPTHVRLLFGRVYLDSGVSSGGKRITIETPGGTAWDVGTQFEVTYAEGRYRVRVREGRVHIRRGAMIVRSDAGDEVSIDARGAVTRERIAPHADEWRWVEALSMPPDFEGRPLSALLDWVTRETGRSVKFEPPEVEQKVRRIILHGDVRALAPMEALDAMLTTTDLAYTMLDDGTIVIRSRGAG